MLKRLYADNFRSLVNFELSPSPVGALVGPNGGGKTTVFAVLKAFQAFLNGGVEVQVAFPASSKTRWDGRNEQRFELEVLGANGRVYLYTLRIEHQPNGHTSSVREEQLTADGQLLYRVANGEVQLFGDAPSTKPKATFPFSPLRSYLALLEPHEDNRLIGSFQDWVHRTFLFSLNPQAVEPVSRGESRSLFHDGSNFVSWFRLLVQEKPQLRERLREDLPSVIPGFTELLLLSDGPSTKLMTVECRVAGRSYKLALDELSDGQRALLVLYSIKHVLASNASILMLDEPDNFLAHREIQPWLSGVRDSMSPEGTLLVISHHPEVIDYLAPDDVWRIYRLDDGPTRIERLEFDLAEGLSASEALKLETS